MPEIKHVSLNLSHAIMETLKNFKYSSPLQQKLRKFAGVI